MSAPTDPRPVYAAATAWMTQLLSSVTDDQLDSPTPCAEFDVRTLASHIVGVANRVVALGEGADLFSVSPFAENHDAETYARTVGRAIDLWADDSRLTTVVKVPWGEVPGAGALWGYVNETLVHCWDLAVATGQASEADPAIVEPTLTIARQFITADIRSDANVPFAQVVEPRPDAGPTERLANWGGRPSEAWVR
ncbi:TIGR03086 family metal-binding protein [Gordonia sp. CPCC 206044]|uniref:TIGR03086 family metal-binding protein n=1 Tax=Gordonia sp. CPCC 206044 TaxID=3140793 RepID=UPI003AF3C3ED